MHDAPDPLACVLAFLRGHTDLPAELDVDRDKQVAGRKRGKWPCLVVTETPAGQGGLVWQTNTELMLQVLDTTDKTAQVGESRQRAILQRCLQIVHALVDTDQPLAGRREVVTFVGPGVAPSQIDDPGVPGQPRWLATVSVNAHPAV